MSEMAAITETSTPSAKELKKAQVIPRRDLSPLLKLLDNADRAKLIKQGAEAKVYKLDSLYESTPENYVPSPILVKYRFPKSYRHAILDSQLTKLRISHEAKSLLRCKRAGVDVPAVRGVDAESGLLLLEWIDGYGSVREVLGGLPEEAEEEDEQELSEEEEEQAFDEVRQRLQRLQLDEDTIMASIGTSIGSMHLADVIHGDLTTSNMLLRASTSASPPPIVLIDFGLSYIANGVEEKAVDLYVLERALSSTHPEEDGKKKEDTYIEKILTAYSARVGPKEWEKVHRRLKDVRLRGRKRSMVG